MSIRRTGSLSLLVALLLLAAFSAAAAPPAKDAFRVTFSGATVTASGVAPKASVLFFALGRQYVPWEEGVFKLDAVVPDDDGDGNVTYMMKDVTAIPARSIWAVCNLDTGDLVVTGPGGYVPVPFDLPGNGMKRGANGQIEKLELIGAEWLEVLLVRPGKGAWRGVIYDGGEGDEDKVNNRHIQRGFTGLTSLAGGDAPDHLTGRDVVVIIDGGKLRYYANRIDQ